jgi:TM2 domain-containing membrane protein YozV
MTLQALFTFIVTAAFIGICGFILLSAIMQIVWGRNLMDYLAQIYSEIKEHM